MGKMMIQGWNFGVSPISPSHTAHIDVYCSSPSLIFSSAFWKSTSCHADWGFKQSTSGFGCSWWIQVTRTISLNWVSSLVPKQFAWSPKINSEICGAKQNRHVTCLRPIGSQMFNQVTQGNTNPFLLILRMVYGINTNLGFTTPDSKLLSTFLWTMPGTSRPSVRHVDLVSQMQSICQP